MGGWSREGGRGGAGKNAARLMRVACLPSEKMKVNRCVAPVKLVSPATGRATSWPELPDARQWLVCSPSVPKCVTNRVQGRRTAGPVLLCWRRRRACNGGGIMLTTTTLSDVVQEHPTRHQTTIHLIAID